MAVLSNNFWNCLINSCSVEARNFWTNPNHIWFISIAKATRIISRHRHRECQGRSFAQSPGLVYPPVLCCVKVGHEKKKGSILEFVMVMYWNPESKNTVVISTLAMVTAALMPTQNENTNYSPAMVAILFR